MSTAEEERTAAIDAHARRFAVDAHGNQKYGDQPYEVHLLRVRQVLMWAGVRNGHVLATAAWLHDVVEDTNVALEQVRDVFGQDVADVVWAVTGTGKNRKERNASAYAKIKAAEERGLQAASLKLADRIANVEASAKSAPDKLSMYRKEWPSFQSALDGMGMPVLWVRLRQALDVSE